MSTAGLRKVGNYEEALAQAIKDEQHVNSVINPYLANTATRIINNPEFQRVKDRLEDDLTQQTKNNMARKTSSTMSRTWQLMPKSKILVNEYRRFA